MSSELRMLFVAHGSPAPGYSDAVQAFAGAWLQRHEGASAEIACLESLAPRFSDALKRTRATVVVPLFLHEGWHARKDVADAIAASGRRVTLLPPLTAEPFLVEALLGRLSESGFDGGAVLLYSHGSRGDAEHRQLRSLAGQIVKRGQVDCRLAVARGEPGLSNRFAEVAEAGEKQVILLPHFLFGGVWQQKLNRQVGAAEQAFGMRIRVAEPLGHHPAMLAMIDSFVAEVEVKHV